MMKKIFPMAAATLLVVLCMSGCGAKESELPPAQFEGGTVEADAISVTMVLAPGETGLLDQLSWLEYADLRGSECFEEIYAWSQANPQVYVRYTVPLPNGSRVASEISALDLSELSHEDVAETVKAIGCLPKLHTVELGKERDKFSWEDVLLIAQACPQATVKYTGELYGQEVKLSDETLDLNHVNIEDGGELVRQLIAIMPNLKFVDMDSCGLSDEQMAVIRDENPGVKVVWRVWFGDTYSVRTDVEKILASKPSVGGMLNDSNCDALKYCTEVKYLDIGHNDVLKNISFLEYMPKLEVCILAMTAIRDIEPIAGCTELEYLEVQTTSLKDLSPLAGLTKLEHLNLCNLGPIEDISPLYNLTKLERLWIGGYTKVPDDQLEELRSIVPNCLINTTVSDPTEGQWRFISVDENWIYHQHPRYIELRQQFGYTDKDYAFYWNDPLY